MIFDVSDLLILVISWYVRLYRPSEECLGPLENISCVCKDWNLAAHSMFVRQAFLSSPGIALLELKKTKMITSERHLDLLKTVLQNTEVSVEEIMAMFIKSCDLESLETIYKMGFSAVKLTRSGQDMVLAKLFERLASEHGGLDILLPKFCGSPRGLQRIKGLLRYVSGHGESTDRLIDSENFHNALLKYFFDEHSNINPIARNTNILASFPPILLLKIAIVEDSVKKSRFEYGIIYKWISWETAICFSGHNSGYLSEIYDLFRDFRFESGIDVISRCIGTFLVAALIHDQPQFFGFLTAAGYDIDVAGDQILFKLISMKLSGQDISLKAILQSPDVGDFVVTCDRNVARTLCRGPFIDNLAEIIKTIDGRPRRKLLKAWIQMIKLYDINAFF